MRASILCCACSVCRTRVCVWRHCAVFSPSLASRSDRAMRCVCILTPPPPPSSRCEYKYRSKPLKQGQQQRNKQCLLHTDSTAHTAKKTIPLTRRGHGREDMSLHSRNKLIDSQNTAVWNKPHSTTFFFKDKNNQWIEQFAIKTRSHKSSVDLHFHSLWAHTHLTSETHP